MTSVRNSIERQAAAKVKRQVLRSARECIPAKGRDGANRQPGSGRQAFFAECRPEGKRTKVQESATDAVRTQS